MALCHMLTASQTSIGVYMLPRPSTAFVAQKPSVTDFRMSSIKNFLFCFSDCITPHFSQYDILFPENSAASPLVNRCAYINTVRNVLCYVHQTFEKYLCIRKYTTNGAFMIEGTNEKL